MGDPKRLRKKYKTPATAWQKTRIEEEKILLKEFGLKNKKELWKTEDHLRRFRDQAKKLIATTGEQAKKEEKQLVEKLLKLNLIKKESELEDILNLDLKAILNRRLQTVVFKRGLAKSPKQARQFIIHGHINIGDKKVTVPSCLILAEEENHINFNPKSSFASLQHPERVKIKSPEKPAEKVKKGVKKTSQKKY